jgi:phasin family protein
MANHTPDFDPANPFAALTRNLESFKVPGLNVASIAETHRADIEAVTRANQATYEAMQAIAAKQSDMLATAMRDAQQATQAFGGAGLTDAHERAVVAKKAYDQAVADIAELAEITRTSQAETLALVSQRAEQQMAEFMKLLTPKG